MTNVEFTTKEKVFYNKYIGNFATPKKLNRSESKLDYGFIEAIETGNITSDKIKKVSEVVPVYTYKTCLTIHGNLPEIARTRIGGYKNVIQNKNGSLEIRYSAIDYEAKKEIRFFVGYNNIWSSKENSTEGIYFEKTLRSENKPEALQMLSQLRAEMEAFNISGLKAKLYCAGYNVWGRYYLVLTVIPLTINASPLSIAAALINQSEGEILARIDAENKESEQRANEAQKARENRDNAKKEATNQLSKYPKQLIQANIGAIYISPVVLNDGKPGFRFYKVENKGNFGRFVLSSYLSRETSVDLSKFAEYRNAKQLKVSDILGETYKVI